MICNVLVHTQIHAESVLFNSEAQGCISGNAMICMLLAFPAVLLYGAAQSNVYQHLAKSKLLQESKWSTCTAA